MGHKISKEQIDPGVKDHIMSFVGDVADLETEVNTDIISAVNSLMVDRVDNAENMGKLANAIGEPVTANHSVDEVVEGLGEMLSTFKTNMMNSGVMVESSDKFKQLIDKIKGLTEGEGNKGIQFAEGTFDDFNINTTTIFKDIELIFSDSYSFTPMYIFITIGKIHDTAVTSGGIKPQTNNVISNALYEQFPNNEDYKCHTTMIRTGYYGDIEVSIQINTITNEHVNISIKHTYGGANVNIGLSDIKYYVIGIGEEDTTLRDSLASILEEEGVSVTEEDDMASLISKVDEEFDRQNNEINIDKQKLVNILMTKGFICSIDDDFEDILNIIRNHAMLSPASSDTGQYFTIWSLTSDLTTTSNKFIDIYSFTIDKYTANEIMMFVSANLMTEDNRFPVEIRIFDTTTNTQVGITSTNSSYSKTVKLDFIAIAGHQYKLQYRSDDTIAVGAGIKGIVKSGTYMYIVLE